MRYFKFTLLIIVFMLLINVKMFVKADTGPKPKVVITFDGLDDSLCYATLLSKQSRNGPFVAPFINEQLPSEDEYEIWKAFTTYEDEFYFLQFFKKVNETKKFDWTYFPPNEFKILLYYPESNEFKISGIYEKYAFDSYYNVKLTDNIIEVTNSYNYTNEIIGLIARILITIAIEILIALLFKLKSKKELLVITLVNVTTQVILNVLLNIVNYNQGPLAFIINYVLLEFVVIIIEMIIFSSTLSHVNRVKLLTYTIVCNVASFGIGILLATLLPKIF